MRIFGRMTTTALVTFGLLATQAVSAAIHHRWDDRLNLLGGVGWDDISRFSRVQVGIDDNGIPGTTVDEDFRDTWHF